MMKQTAREQAAASGSRRRGRRWSALVMAALLCIAAGLGTYTASAEGTPPGGQGGGGGAQPGGGGQTTSASYSAATEITEDETELKDEELYSETANQNVILATGDIKATLSKLTISKTGDADGGDTSNFYGTNAGILAKDGAVLKIKSSTITTDADGANGVFSYGGAATTDNTSSDGTKIKISNTKITTTGDNAGGIMATGGGTIKAKKLTVKTSGISSAAIRSDRGGGTIEVEGGSYTSGGAGSPAIYSTADITVSDAKLKSTAAEGVVIEGKNSVSLTDCTLNDNNTKLNGQSTTYKNIFIYQSMSGDSDEGSGTFKAKNCTIKTKKGDTLYVTNTQAKITLKNCEISNSDEDGNFLRAQADSWGNSGSNGGDVTLKLSKQKAKGNIVIDSVSTLKMTITKASSYTGTINGDNTAKSITLKLSEKSKLKLTGDSYVTSFEDANEDYSNVDFNGYTLYVNGTAITG